jgi:hypothetical protein
MSPKGEAIREEWPERESSGTTAAAPRPAAVDAVRWGAALMTQLGLDPRANRTAA